MPGGPPQYGYRYPPPVYPEESQATIVLVLGILGLVFCQLLSPVAWVMGKNELAAIDAGRRDPMKRDSANAGRILGIVGTALIILSLAVIAFFVVIALASSAASTVN